MVRLALIFFLGGLVVLCIYRLMHGKKETLLLLRRFSYLALSFIGLIGLIFLYSVEEVRIGLDFFKSFFN